MSETNVNIKLLEQRKKLCIFKGYHLEGAVKTTCDFYDGAADPTFNNPPPICKR